MATYSLQSSPSRLSTTAFRGSTNMWHISAVPLSFHHILALKFWDIITKSKVHHWSLNFLWCVIPVHELSKSLIDIPKLSSDI
jgi:hypothetical protein